MDCDVISTPRFDPTAIKPQLFGHFIPHNGQHMVSTGMAIGNVFSNPLLRLHLLALRVFGYAICDQNQVCSVVDSFRGVILTGVFVVFNVTQVNISINVLNILFE